MVQTFEEAASIISRTLSSKYPLVNRAFIFGSFARGEQTDHSDIDIMVELSEPMGLDFYGMLQDIEDAAGRPIDMLTAKRAQELETKYEYDILGKARVIYERPAH